MFLLTSDSFFGEQVNLETENRFVPLTKKKKDRSSPCGTNKSTFISGLKFISMNIISIRGKKLELLAFLDFNQPHVVAIQETKIDSSIATSELFPETCPYSVYKKDRNIHGGRVMLLVHKDISHMPITELENDSESIWVKVFANKTSHFVANWYRPPDSTSEEFQLFREQLDYIRTRHTGKKLPSVHVRGDFNFKDIDWPDRLSKSGSKLSQSQLMTIVMRPFCWHKNFGSNGLSAPAQGLCVNFFSSITADFNIALAFRGAIQDQWSSGFFNSWNSCQFE